MSKKQEDQQFPLNMQERNCLLLLLHITGRIPVNLLRLEIKILPQNLTRAEFITGINRKNSGKPKSV